MKITDIRETSIALNSTLKNSSIDFSEMTTSVTAVITDVKRDGKPVIGYAFNSTGRYACGAQMRARFIPRLLKADPRSLLNEAGDTMVKMKIGGAPLAEDIKRIEAVKRILPPHAELAVDANSKFDLKEALAYAKAMAPYRLRWFEEPCDPLDFATLAEISEAY